MSRHTPWIPCESVKNSPRIDALHHFTFRRTGEVNANGSIPGELTLGPKTWPTVERGDGHTFVRKGDYTLMVDYKNTDRAGGVKVKCLRFNHEGIKTHLIHDALNDKHTNLLGCIGPGLEATDTGIRHSEKAMAEIWDAIGGWVDGKLCTITVENNIVGDETAADWIARRKSAIK